MTTACLGRLPQRGGVNLRDTRIYVSTGNVNDRPDNSKVRKIRLTTWLTSRAHIHLTNGSVPLEENKVATAPVASA